MERERVIVLGAGPAGLAAGGALRAARVDALLVDQADRVGSSWHAHYDRLRLHTARRFSALPGLPIPRAYGDWVARENVARYLADYAAHHRLRVRLNTRVAGLRRSDDGWIVDTATGTLTAPTVIVATGYNHTPFIPDWPGRAGFTGELVHAARYKNAAPYRGRDVLVVGGGNSGAEIAVDLVEGGAARVALSIRTPPNIVLRSLGGVSATAMTIALRPLPPPFVDRLVRVIQRLTIGDLSRWGLPRPPRGAFTSVLRDGQIPIIDVGLVELVKAGRIVVVPAVVGFDGAEVLLADGSRRTASAVIAATGYQRGLEQLVGALGLLDERGLPVVHGAGTLASAPGLHFIGYTNPVSGNLRELGRDAVAIARTLAPRP
jgi:cation diffusion facilitator CzcD-associated flavoprotein CzcO